MTDDSAGDDSEEFDEDADAEHYQSIADAIQAAQPLSRQETRSMAVRMFADYDMHVTEPIVGAMVDLGRGHRVRGVFGLIRSELSVPVRLFTFLWRQRDPRWTQIPRNVEHYVAGDDEEESETTVRIYTADGAALLARLDAELTVFDAEGLIQAFGVPVDDEPIEDDGIRPFRVWLSTCGDAPVVVHVGKGLLGDLDEAASRLIRPVVRQVQQQGRRGLGVTAELHDTVGGAPTVVLTLYAPPSAGRPE
jgi:hypothetical protein